MNASELREEEVVMSHAEFMEAWNAANPAYQDGTVAINWAKAGNGTGYLDHLRGMLRGERGDTFSLIDDRGRRVLVIAHGYTTDSSVLFERLAKSTLVVCNLNHDAAYKLDVQWTGCVYTTVKALQEVVC